MKQRILSENALKSKGSIKILAIRSLNFPQGQALKESRSSQSIMAPHVQLTQLSVNAAITDSKMYKIEIKGSFNF